MSRGDAASVVVGYLRKREVGSPFDEDLRTVIQETTLIAFRYLTFQVWGVAHQRIKEQRAVTIEGISIGVTRQ